MSIVLKLEKLRQDLAELRTEYPDAREDIVVLESAVRVTRNYLNQPDIPRVIADVYADYTRDSGKKPAVSGLERLCSAYPNADASELYAVCMHYLWYAGTSGQDPEACYTEFRAVFTSPADSDIFRWRPAELDTACELSTEVFEYTKRVWRTGNTAGFPALAVSRLQELEEALESLEYVYADKDTLLREYYTVYHEALADANCRHGDWRVLSARMRAEIGVSLPDSPAERTTNGNSTTTTKRSRHTTNPKTAMHKHTECVTRGVFSSRPPRTKRPTNPRNRRRGTRRRGVGILRFWGKC